VQSDHITLRTHSPPDDAAAAGVPPTVGLSKGKFGLMEATQNGR
jgi:hypothetical protein